MKICYRYSNAMEECEEIVNEGFIKLFKNVHQFDETRQEDTLLSLKGWFKRILINTCIDHYRKSNSSVNGHVLTHHESETIADQGENGIDMLSYKKIIEAIRLLSPAYRAVFNLFVIDGYSHEEIASRLDISVGTSKSNLFKAREHLKAAFKKNNIKRYA